MGKTGLPPQELLKYMLKGFADLLGNLIEEVNAFTRKGLSDRQKELDNLQSKLDLNELEAGGWRGITGRGIDASKIRDLMGEIYGSNNSVAFAKIAGILKYTLKSFTYTFGRALDLAGMDPGVAGEIAEGFKLGLDSFLDLVIHQSFGGGGVGGQVYCRQGGRVVTGRPLRRRNIRLHETHCPHASYAEESGDFEGSEPGAGREAGGTPGRVVMLFVHRHSARWRSSNGSRFPRSMSVTPAGAAHRTASTRTFSTFSS